MMMRLLTLWRSYVLIHHVMGNVDGLAGAWAYVEGGMGAVSEAIARCARAHGASIFTGKVWFIIGRKERICDRGLKIMASVVVMLVHFTLSSVYNDHVCRQHFTANSGYVALQPLFKHARLLSYSTPTWASCSKYLLLPVMQLGLEMSHIPREALRPMF